MARIRTEPPNYFRNPITLDLAAASPIPLYVAAGGAPPTPAVGGKGLKPAGTARAPYENERVVITAIRVVNTAATPQTVVLNDGPGGTPLVTLNLAIEDDDEVIGRFVCARGQIPEFVVTGTGPAGEIMVQADTETLNDLPRPAAGQTVEQI